VCVCNMFILTAIKMLFFFYFSVDTSTKTVGYKEGSGFTHAYNDEPITFNPMEAHEGIRDVRLCTYKKSCT